MLIDWSQEGPYRVVGSSLSFYAGSEEWISKSCLPSSLSRSPPFISTASLYRMGRVRSSYMKEDPFLGRK